MNSVESSEAVTGLFRFDFRWETACFAQFGLCEPTITTKTSMFFDKLLAALLVVLLLKGCLKLQAGNGGLG